MEEDPAKTREDVFLNFSLVTGGIMQTLTRTSKVGRKELLRAVERSLAIMEFALDGTILSANANYLSISGYRLQDLVGNNHKCLCSGEHILSKTYADCWEKVKLIGCSSGLFPRQRKDGSEYWIQAVYYTVFSESDAQGRIVKFCLDVTDRMKQTSEKSILLDALDRSLILAEYSPQGDFLSLNENFITALGFARADILGRRLAEVFPLLDPQGRLLNEIWRNVCAGRTYYQKMEWKASSGESVWLATLFTPIFTAEGRLKKILQVATDVTFAIESERRRGQIFQKLSLVADNTSNGVVIADSAGKTTYVNAGFSAMFGYTEKDLAGRSATCIFGPEEIIVARKMRERLGAKESFSIEEIAYSKGGQRLWVSWIANAVCNDEEKQEYIVIVITDITDTKLHEVLQRKALEGMARDVPTEESLGIVCLEIERILPEVRVRVMGVDKQNRLYAVASPSAPAMFSTLQEIPISPTGSPSVKALYFGSTVIERDIVSSQYPEEVKEMFTSASVRGCLAKAIKDGNGNAIGVASFYYRDECVPDDFQLRTIDVMARIGAIAIEREKSRADVRHLIFYDSITGLPNRDLLLASADNLIAESMADQPGTPFAIFCINIDRFKRINRSRGYGTGNEVLKKIGKRLQEIKGPSDLAGRMSADEFLLLMVGCDAEKAMEQARRIQKDLSRPLEADKSEVVLTACIGVSLYPEHANKAEYLINNATTAMAAGKRKGPGQIRFYDQKLKTSNTDTLSLEAKLHTAIQQEKLQLYYQPQVNMRTGQLYGVEALCRWQDKEAGSIPPSSFIPLAEESGLITQLSDWVLRESCKQLGLWRKQGLPVPRVSVNLSPSNFLDVSLLEKILQCLDEHRLKPSDIMLELTESVLLDNDLTTMSTLKKAHNIGIQLALDDFGTGYSSLSYLRELPISEIKLDQYFVFDLDKNEVSQRLSQAVLCIGESLGLTVVAEGIETMEQYTLLKQQRYHVAQGFLLSTPVPTREFEVWLKSWRPLDTGEQYLLA